MKKLVKLLLFIPTFAFCQSLNFVSDCQIENTYDGNIKKGFDYATIQFIDTKKYANQSDELEDRPIGEFNIKFPKLKSSMNHKIVYIGEIEKDVFLYSILLGGTDNNVVVVAKESKKIGKKTYSYKLIIGKNIGGGSIKFSYSILFYANLKI